jgi:hypothetical protein
MFVEPDQEPVPARVARQAPTGPSSFWEVAGASLRRTIIEDDWYDNLRRREREVYGGVWSAVQGAYGPEEVNRRFEEAGLFTTRLGPRQFQDGAAYRRVLWNMVSDMSEDLYGEMPRSSLDVRQQTTEQLRAEWQDAVNTSEMGPNGSWLAEFLGAAPVVLTDPMNLLLMPLGSARGGIARVAAREAAINAAAEAAIVPTQQRVADEIGIEAPNPLAQVAAGAVLGGGFGALGEALSRGISYARIRQELTNLPDDMSLPAAQTAAEVATEGLSDGRSLAEIDAEMEALGLFQVTERPAEAAPARERFPTEEEIEQARRDIIADNPELDRNRPTMDFLRQSGGIQWTRTNPNTGERELTPIASELQGMGISQRQLLGILRRDGMADVDNIVAADFADGGTPRLRTDDTGTYLARDALIEAIVQEAGGRPAYRTAEAEAAAARLADLEESFERIAREQGEVARVEGVDPRSGLNPPVEGDDALARADAAERIDMDYEADGADIPGSIRRDAQRIMADEGGDYEDALYDAILRAERERSDAGTQAPQASGTEALPLDDAGTGAGRAQPAAAADAGGLQARSGDVQRRTEQTAAGEQFVTPGVEPVSLRESLEASMDAPMRGGDALANDGLFDLNARLQRDMFDDLSSPDATARMDAEEAEFREAIDAGEFDLTDTGVVDGQAISARYLLDQNQADMAHLDAITNCRWGGPRGET